MTSDVTVVVIAYRHAPYLRQCLDSIRDQTHRCRIVVVDDHSPDDTSAVVHAWTGRHPEHPLRFVVNERNLGLGASLDLALRLVDTPFVAYLAGDDWLEPDRTEVQRRALLEAGPRAALAYSDAYRTDAQGQRKPELFSEVIGTDWRPYCADPYAELVEVNWIPAPTMLLRTDALRAIGGYDPQLFYEDHDVCLRLARDHELVFVDRVLATHREVAGSLGDAEFRPGSARWRQARIRIYLKHVGAREPVGSRVVTRLRELTLAAYRAGDDPRLVRRAFTALAPRVPARDRAFHGYRRAARLRLPGPLLARLRPRRAPGAGDG